MIYDITTRCPVCKGPETHEWVKHGKRYYGCKYKHRPKEVKGK